MIKETFEMLKKSGKLEIPITTKAESEKIKEYEENVNALNMQIENIKKTISKTGSELKKIVEELRKSRDNFFHNKLFFKFLSYSKFSLLLQPLDERKYFFSIGLGKFKPFSMRTILVQINDAVILVIHQGI